MVDKFDRLARGQQFDSKRTGAVIGNDWVEASVWFDADVCQYKVKFRYDGHSVEKEYDKEEDALKRYRQLVADYELD